MTVQGPVKKQRPDGMSQVSAAGQRGPIQTLLHFPAICRGCHSPAVSRGLAADRRTCGHSASRRGRRGCPRARRPCVAQSAGCVPCGVLGAGAQGRGAGSLRGGCRGAGVVHSMGRGTEGCASEGPPGREARRPCMLGGGRGGPDMPLASGTEPGSQWQSAPYHRPLSNTRPPAPPELSRNVLRPACGSVGACSI